MAIAYYIPDQAKLLARSSNGGGSQQNMNNNQQYANQSTSTAPSGTRSPTRRRSPTRPTTANTQHQQQQHHYQGQQENYTYSSRNNHFRANISIPLPQRQGSMTTGRQAESFGCWELLAQIFCYALRFYNYTSTQRMPTVIQISFEISRRNSSSQTNSEPSQAGSGTSSTTSNGKNQRH